MLDNLLNILHPQNTQLNTVLHIGAGRCSEWDKYIASNAQKIILVEPYVEYCKKLAKKTKSHANTTIIEAALSTNDKATLHVCNNPRFNSLNKLKANQNVIPNLEQTQELNVVSITINQIFNNYLNINPETENKSNIKPLNNLLVVDALGISNEVFSSIIAEQLAFFSYIIINIAPSELYENSVGINACISTMENIGFYFITHSNINNEITEIVFKQNVLQTQLAKLTQQKDEHKHWHLEHKKWNQTLKDENSKLITTIDNLKQTVEKSQHEANQLTTKLNEQKIQIEVLKNECEEKDKKLISANNKNSEIETILNTLSTELEQKIAQLELITNENLKQKQLIESQKTDISVLSQQKEEQTHWHHQNKKWAETLVKEVETLKTDLKENMRTIELSQKLQLKSQLDLDNLRLAYKDKLDSERELIELVKELKNKLEMAAEYYNQLEQLHPELLNDNQLRDNN
jgi:hypothetical protein